MDDIEYLFKLGPLKHEPIRPPRAKRIGEEVFAASWRELMQKPLPFDEYEAPNKWLSEILHKVPEPLCQRHADAAASLICWLGTNCGLSFIDQAKRIEAKLPGYGSVQAWRFAWASKNCRSPGCNHGFRTIEFLLAPEDHYGNNGMYGYGLLRAPELSVIDYEVMDCVVEWLAMGEGREFIADCEREIKEKILLEHVRLRAEANLPPVER